ncbi:MAG: hypothetical protein VYA84_21670 [Planctomycetota bacterium]|nr:hypothetical protein [Planctomycetota bacterium]
MATGDDVIHPLDRDDSAPLSPTKTGTTSLSSWDHIAFAAEFPTIVPATICRYMFTGGWTESIGSFLH